MSDEKKPLDVAAIRTRCDAATPGPWEVSFGQNDDLPKYAYADTVTGDRVSLNASASDALFIAHAREDIPVLVAEVEALRVQNARLELALREATQSLVTAVVWANDDATLQGKDDLRPWLKNRVTVAREALAELDASTVSPPTVDNERRCKHCKEIIAGVPLDFMSDEPVYCSLAHAVEAINGVFSK